jgi:hypothetical protein
VKTTLSFVFNFAASDDVALPDDHPSLRIAVAEVAALRPSSSMESLAFFFVLG